jgi:prolyl-tRNA editing enzyme YbaK/EbsC (Cys-tRNA(Pro) deacylase)
MNELLNKESVKRVEESLKKFDPNLKILVLDTTARTAKDAANSLKCELGAIVKSLVFRAENDFLICLVAGDKRCSLNKLKKFLNKKDVSMANADQVKENTGFSIGGVAPTGHLKKLNIIVDKSLSRFKYVYGAAGHPDCVFRITYPELVRLTTGSEQEITE